MNEEVDVLVAEARRMQSNLNQVLDKLDPLGVTCDSVIGSMDNSRRDTGMLRSINRVQLNLTFASALRAE